MAWWHCGLNQSTIYVHSSESCRLSGIFRMQFAFEIPVGGKSKQEKCPNLVTPCPCIAVKKFAWGGEMSQAGRQLLYNLGLIPRPLPLQHTHKARHGVHVCKPVLGGRDRHRWGSVGSRSHSRPVRNTVSKPQMWMACEKG